MSIVVLRRFTLPSGILNLDVDKTPREAYYLNGCSNT